MRTKSFDKKEHKLKASEYFREILEDLEARVRKHGFCYKHSYAPEHPLNLREYRINSFY